MGQTSLRYLNRVGYNLHWGGVWESKNVYSNTFLKFFFLESLFTKLLKNNLFKTTNIALFKSSKFLKKKSFLFHNTVLFLSSGFFNYNTSKFFNSKLWLLSYQGWVIMVIYLYFPNKKKRMNLFLKRSKKVRKLTKLKKYNKLLLNYNFI